MPNVTLMSRDEKVKEMLQRSIPFLPGEAKQIVSSMLTPQSIAIIVGTFTLWIASHALGVGEIIDVVLLIVGFATIGLSVFEGAKEIYLAAELTLNAKGDEDLTAAAKHFAAAITILGVAVVTALLMRNTVKNVKQPFRHRVGPPPPITKPPITRTVDLGETNMGNCDSYGFITIFRNNIPNVTEGKMTLMHEWVHRILSPRIIPLRQIRAQLKQEGYWRSYILRYLEEALAESFAQLKVQGFSVAGLIKGLAFPLQKGYIQTSSLGLYMGEGTVIGQIAAFDMMMNVAVTENLYEASFPKGNPVEGLQKANQQNLTTGNSYVVLNGDSLSVIARKMYGDVLLWPVIYDANKSTIGPNWNLVRIGQRYKIPDIKGYSALQISEIKTRGKNWR